MQDSIIVSAPNPMDLMTKKAALEEIEKTASAKELKALAELAKNPKAKEYLSNPVKFAMLKKFL